MLILASLLLPNYLVLRGAYVYKVVVWAAATAVMLCMPGESWAVRR